MPSNMSFMVHVTFLLSSVYSILLLSLYIIKRDATIPLTYRTPMYDWGALKKLIDNDPIHFNQAEFRSTLWCKGADTSPQCSCLYNYSEPNSIFTRNAETFLLGGGPASASELAKRQYTDLINACLRQRTSWRKDTCEYWCKVHLATPVALACLFVSLFLSRVVRYDSRLLQMSAELLPLGVSLVTIAAHLGIDLYGGIVAALSVLSALLEYGMYSCACVDEAQVYWNTQRFVAATMAVWAAASHQARDVYLITCYAVLGFFLGMLGYTQYLMRYRQGCNGRVRIVSLYVWVGMCMITVCFLLLVQQHLYPASPMWSSAVSLLALSVICVQCSVNAPGVCVSDTIQMGVTLAVLSFATLATAWDVLSMD